MAFYHAWQRMEAKKFLKEEETKVVKDSLSSKSMLKKQYRLPAQIKLTRPSSLFTPSFNLKIATNNLGYSRFGFIVSKRIDKRAVKRNRLKRVIRACIEKMQNQIKDGYDMLFVMQKNSKEANYKFLCQEVESALKTKQLLI